MTNPVFLGIDVGTSGVRGCCIDSDGKQLAAFQKPLELPTIRGNNIQQHPDIWKQTVHEIISHLSQQIEPRQIAAIAIDGTSSTVLVCDTSGNPLSPALMYNDQSRQHESIKIAAIAPENCAAHGATSSLAKAMHLLEQHADASHICHQADWIAGTLSGRYDISDENNCLKLGYDLINNAWPDWLSKLDIAPATLPKVQTPGSVIGRVLKEVAEDLGLSLQCKIIAGTTDSIAAFIATGAKNPGEAVTSLGSTLVLKIISDKPVFAPEYGIYSHRLGKLWLAGGASNSGGRVLSQHFTKQQIRQMTPRLQPEQATGLNYYPLPATGERFPTNDPGLQNRLSPRPENDLHFFQGMLEGIANIELEAYKQLARLGAPFPEKIFTAGGGSCNAAWAKIREQKMGIPVLTASHTEASYGVALLAQQGYLTNT